MLVQAQINTIEAKAKTILESVFGSIIDISIPVPLEKILERYDLTAAVGEFEDEEVSGAYEREHKMIYVAEDEPANRKAFTIAHEIGHYFLHETKKHEVFYRAQIINIPDEGKKEEQEANWFAAALLMPEGQLEHYYNLTKDIGELAVVFGVSSTAVYFRLKNLGIVS